MPENNDQKKVEKSVVLLPDAHKNTWMNKAPVYEKKPREAGEEDIVIKVDNNDILQNMQQIALSAVQKPSELTQSIKLSQTMNQTTLSNSYVERETVLHIRPSEKKQVQSMSLKLDQNIEPEVDDCEEELKKTNYYKKVETDQNDEKKDDKKEDVESKLYQNQRDLYKFSLTNQEDCSIVNEKLEFTGASKDPKFLTRFTQIKIEDAEMKQAKEQREANKKKSQEEETKNQDKIVQHKLSNSEKQMVSKNDKNWEYMGAQHFRLVQDKKKDDKKTNEGQDLDSYKQENLKTFEIQVGFDQRKTKQVVKEVKEGEENKESKIFQHEDQKIVYPKESCLKD